MTARIRCGLTHRNILRTFISLTVALVVGCGGPADILTLGGVLDNTLGQVNEAIKTAREAGRLLEVQAGNELAISIENMKLAYDDSLDKTVDKIDGKIRQNLDKIIESANRLERHIVTDVQGILEQTQQIANTLPLSNKFPQVRAYGPLFFVTNSSTSTTPIRISGNFPQSAEPDYRPYILTGEKRIEPSEVLTQHLLFEIPIEDTPSVAGSVRFFNLRLVVPYKRAGWFKKKQEGQFILHVGALPSPAGTVTIRSKHWKDLPERQHIVTQSWNQHSSNDDFKGIEYSSQKYFGWKVIEPSVRFVVEWSQGSENDEWSKSLVSTDNGRVTYTVTTIYHRIGTSGKINFHFEFDIERTQKVDTYLTDSFAMQWGESRVFPYPLGTWKVRFVPFRGDVEEFVASSSTNPYLRITVDGIWLKLKVASPSDLVSIQEPTRPPSSIPIMNGFGDARQPSFVNGGSAPSRQMQSIVDAAMRQLLHTGVIDNSSRLGTMVRSRASAVPSKGAAAPTTPDVPEFFELYKD